MSTLSKKYSPSIPLCFGFLRILSSPSSCHHISFICLLVYSKLASFFVISSVILLVVLKLLIVLLFDSQSFVSRVLLRWSIWSWSSFKPPLSEDPHFLLSKKKITVMRRKTVMISISSSDIGIGLMIIHLLAPYLSYERKGK